jgi:hypothetical protein
MSIQMALSVGDPVKNLETSELKESVALIPTRMRTMPPTSRAREMILFINGLSVSMQFQFASDPAAANEIGQHQDQRDNQEYMKDSSQRVAGDKTEEPQNNQNYRNRV